MGPLDGVLVVDLGTFYAGPFGSTMLADQGATVVKVEPLTGDPIRFQTSMPEATAVRVTQGKKSVAVDVFTERGRQIVVELVRRADIVLHSYRGGVAERMGLDADTMTRLNPDLVYHHGVGYGVDGPYARRAAFAPTIAAASGFAMARALFPISRSRARSAIRLAIAVLRLSARCSSSRTVIAPPSCSTTLALNSCWRSRWNGYGT